MGPEEKAEKSEHVDPVCGMTVAGDSKYQFEYAGERYYFCSEHCLREFKEHPEKFLKKRNPAILK